MGEGKLPNFSRLSSNGIFSPLQTSVPPQSPVAWTTIATGRQPGVHGVFDFLTRDAGEYLPKSNILKQGKLGYIRTFHTKTFWEVASENGIPATILKWPLTFPATPLKGSLLTGLGTPDIRGTLGIYSFFTTRDISDQGRKKGMIHRVSQTGDTVKATIVGPLKFSFRATKEATIPLEIRLGDDHIVCCLDGQTFTVPVGSWSPWIPVTFKVGLMQTAKGLCRFFLESIKPDFNLYMTPINIGNTVKSPPISYPPGYAGRLAQEIGPFSTLGLAEDANALDDEIIGEEAFLAGCNTIMQERESLFFSALENFTEGILACVFDTTDRIQHMFWRYIDASHPLHDISGAAKYDWVIPSYYERADAIVGQVLDRFGKDALILVCSDHGFASYRRSVHLNDWLVENGFMNLEPGRGVGVPLFDGVDWPATRAYALGLNSLFLNVKNRETKGVVAREQIGVLKQTLKSELKAMHDLGEPVVREVYDVEDLGGREGKREAPDLIVCYEPGYRTSWQSALGEVTGEGIFADNMRKWSGDHCCDPAAVPGIFFANEKHLLEKPHVKDVSPLILNYLHIG